MFASLFNHGEYDILEPMKHWAHVIFIKEGSRWRGQYEEGSKVIRKMGSRLNDILKRYRESSSPEKKQDLLKVAFSLFVFLSL